MEEKIVGILKSVGELLVATLVEETDTVVKIKDAALLAIRGADGQVNVEFIPIEMLSLSPPVNVRNLLANPVQELVYELDKSTLFKYDLELSSNVIENYKTLVNKSTTVVATPDKSANPEDNVIKLF